VLGGGFATLPGGKGANQACAAARLGGRVRMVGRVGDDVFGSELRRGLAAEGVDAQAVLVSEATPSGVALICVESSGQNQIVVASGANARLTPGDVAAGLAGVPDGLLLLQLESPLETVEHAATLAARRGLRVVLDPAPACALSGSLLSSIWCLTPNESEAMTLLGRPAGAVSLADAPEAARELRLRGPRVLILKLGARGAWVDDESGGRHFPAPKVEAVDATAAGDTFNGALAVALAEDRALDDAVAFANAAAALSVTRRGAQASIPSRHEVAAIEERR